MKSLTIIAIAALTLASILVGCESMSAGVAQKQQSSWGNLEWFELEIDPFILRFSVLPGLAIVYSKDIHDKEHGLTWVLERDDPKAAAVIRSLDALIREHHLMESTPNEPQKTFQTETVKTPSVHMRIGYGTDGQGRNKRWQSYYRSDNLPPNIKAFIEACRNMGDSLGQSGGPPMPEEEFLRKTTGKEIAKIKITAKGDIYLNDKQVPLEQMTTELKRLKEADGEVLYYRESPEENSQGKATAVVDAVMRKIKELKLRMVTSKKGF
jgi:hypothetical protein